MSKCSTSYSLAYIQDGTDGKNGTSVTIASKSIEYVTSDSGTTTPSDSAAWTDTPAPEKGKYLWSRTTINYSDANKAWSTVTYSVSYIGTNGQDGASGRGIKSIQEKYAISDSDTTAPSPFYDEVKTPTPEKRFLWNYEIITYTDGKSEPTAYRVIGVYGEAGKDGEDGNGISSVVSKYLATTASSGVTTSTSGWDTAVPTLKEGQYLWSYEIITYTKTDPVNTTPRIIGSYGKQGEKGTSGAYTLFKYALNNDAQNAPATSSFSSTMPAITTTNPYLWIMVGNVAAGKTDSDAVWSSPTLLGTDSSEVYAKLEETKTSFNEKITEITKEGGTIETKIGEYKIDSAGNTIEKVSTLFEQKADKIELALKVTENGDIADKNGNEITGIKIANGKIELDARETIADGTIKADKIDTASLMAQDLVVGKQIRSAEYDTDGNQIKGYDAKGNLIYKTIDEKKVPTTGFYLDKDGNLKATNATFNNATAIDLDIDGGEITSTSFRTVQQTSAGDSFSSVKSGEYYSSEDVASLIESNATVTKHVTASEVDNASAFTINDTAYKLIRNIDAVREDSLYYSTDISSFDGSGTYTFNVPDGYSKVYLLIPMQTCKFYRKFTGVWMGFDDPPSDLTYEYFFVDCNYRLNGGDSVYIQKDSFQGPNTLELELSVNAGSTNTITFSPTYAVGYSSTSKDSEYTRTRTVLTTTDTAFGFYLPSTFPDGSFVTTTGIFLFKSSTEWTAYSSLSLPDYMATTISGISDKTKYYRYEKFVQADDNTTVMADRNADYSALTIGSTSYAGGSLSLSNNNFVIRDSSGSIILNINLAQYFMAESAYEDISFTVIGFYKGAYVSDLFPLNAESSIGSDTQPFVKSYAETAYVNEAVLPMNDGEGNIGSATQKFNAVYAKSLDVETFTSDTIRASQKPIKVWDSNKGTNGYWKIMNITVNETWMDAPIEMEFIGRAYDPYKVILRYSSGDTASPSVGRFSCYSASQDRPFYRITNGNSTDIYYKKDTSYASLALLSLRTNDTYMAGVTITLEDEFLTSLSGATQAVNAGSKYSWNLLFNSSLNSTGSTATLSDSLYNYEWIVITVYNTSNYYWFSPAVINMNILYRFIGGSRIGIADDAHWISLVIDSATSIHRQTGDVNALVSVYGLR